MSDSRPMSFLSTVRDAWTVARSGLFDRDYYVRSHKDLAPLADSTVKPLIHFVRHGGFEGRRPSQLFDTRFYLAAHPDVARDGYNPLVHYLLFGRRQGRRVNLPYDAKCSICGYTKFIHGPYHRTGVCGQLPQCAKCNSLERHRALRSVWNAIPAALMSGRKTLQFSYDVSVKPEWFGSYELSEYEGENPIDLQDIQRDSKSYDIVVCNHVLEHVQDDRKAFCELMRIVRDDGYIQLSFPEPLVRAVTEDWGYPKPNDHYHYRRFGADVIGRFQTAQRDAHCLYVLTHDPVTGFSDCLYFFSRSKDVLVSIETALFEFWTERHFVD